MPTTRPIAEGKFFAPVQTGDLQIVIMPGTVFLNGVAVVTTNPTTFNLVANATTSIYADLTTGALASATTGFPLACYPICTVATGPSVITPKTGFTDVRPSFMYSGMPLVGFTTLSSSATAVISVAGTFKQLIGWCDITFYSVGDTISVRYGNTTTVDAGNNYNYRWGTMAAGGNTWSSSRDSTADSNNSLIKMAAQDTTLSREITFSISNNSNKVKQMQLQAATETAGTSTLPSLDIGQGQWFNTAGQIGCFQCLTAGANNFGGSIAFYGSK